MTRKTAPVAVHELYPSLHRKYRILDGTWKFMLDPENAGECLGYSSSDEGYHDTIEVPGCLEAQGKGITYHEPERPGWWGTSDRPYLGVSWAACSFEAPERKPDEEVWLHFGGIGTEADVYLNGEKLAHHKYAIIPFGLDVTEKIKPGLNFLAVKVQNTHRYERVPENHNGLGSTCLEIMWSLAITKDRNHASAFVWCMGNEKQFPYDWIRHFAAIARAADPTRFILSDSPGWTVQSDDNLVRWPVMHEFRMSGASYLDLSLEKKYTTKYGRPWRIMYTQKQLAAHGLLPLRFPLHGFHAEAPARMPEDPSGRDTRELRGRRGAVQSARSGLYGLCPVHVPGYGLLHVGNGRRSVQGKSNVAGNVS